LISRGGKREGKRGE
jgi:hypothetical protein